MPQLSKHELFTQKLVLHLIIVHKDLQGLSSEIDISTKHNQKGQRKKRESRECFGDPLKIPFRMVLGNADQTIQEK